jgi:hypothetical protein
MTDQIIVPGQIPTPQTFPQIAINITPEGMTIMTALAPGLTLTMSINEQDMNHIAGQWLETRKQIKQQLAIIQDVRRTKNNGK